MASMLVQNTQQYYDQTKKFRIVGQLAQEAGEMFVDVSPESILGFYDFVPIDGTQPIDRLAQANLWQQFFAQIAMMPQITMQYNIGRIFEWVAQLAGLKNISQFRMQMLPDAELAKMAAQGNVIPIGGGGQRTGGGTGVESPGGVGGSPPPLNTAGQGGPQVQNQ